MGPSLLCPPYTHLSSSFSFDFVFFLLSLSLSFLVLLSAAFNHYDSGRRLHQKEVEGRLNCCSLSQPRPFPSSLSLSLLHNSLTSATAARLQRPDLASSLPDRPCVDYKHCNSSTFLFELLRRRGSFTTVAMEGLTCLARSHHPWG